MQDIKQQLTPGWSPVNIGLLVILYFLIWPLALLMLAYILWGQKLDLDLSRPETISVFWKRLSVALRVGMDSFNRRS